MENYIYLIIGLISGFNLLLLLLHICLYRWRSSSRNLTNPPCSTSKNRTIERFQRFHTLHSGPGGKGEPSSVVIPSSILDSSVPLTPATDSRMPDHVTCTATYPHRKVFLGVVEWAGFRGFLKECLNPFELNLHRNLHHENIVKFLWSNIADRPRLNLGCEVQTHRQLPISFYCMELCPEGSLNSFLVREGHQMMLNEAMGVIKGVCQGLKYMHDLGVVHRDLKSENILIQISRNTASLIAKICDFDHAVNTKNASDMQFEQTRRCKFGSPLYTAPEFILEKLPSPSAADLLHHDIYCLSLVLWEVLTWVKCKQNLLCCPTLASQSQTSVLLPQESGAGGANQDNRTTDLGDLRSRVKCSSTIHIPLLKQVCVVLNLRWNKEESVLKKNGIFFKRSRLIDTELMREFYTASPDARPVLFRSADGVTGRLNVLMAKCWNGVPCERPSISEVCELLRDIG